MRRLGLGLLTLGVLLGCRYRFSPGIYVPLQVGTLYRYTSRFVLTGKYESPRGKYYTPDTLHIVADTSYGGYEARKVYVRKTYECQKGQVCNPTNPLPTCYCVADTFIYYLKEDTLVMVAEPLRFLPPRFRVILEGRPHFVSITTDSGRVPLPLFYTLAGPGDSWDMARGEATIKVYPVGYDTVPDSVDTYDVSFRIRAEVEGFEDTETSYGHFNMCAKVRYDLYLSGGIPDVTLHAMDMWWCDGVGQVKYVYTPEAASYKDSTLTYLELSIVEGK